VGALMILTTFVGPAPTDPELVVEVSVELKDGQEETAPPPAWSDALNLDGPGG
jgi:hypothetical protein